MMIKPYLYAGAAVVCFVAGWSVNGSLWQSKFDSHILEDAKANQAAAESALARQKNLLQELDDAYKAQKELTEKHDRIVADSRASADRMRQQLDRIKTTPADSGSGSIAERANAATDKRVLAELLGISDQLAGRYAEEVGRHQLALSACINEYESVRLVVSSNDRTQK